MRIESLLGRLPVLRPSVLLHRRSWQYFGLLALFLAVVHVVREYNTSSYEYADFLPSNIQPKLPKVLRPGEYGDPTRQRRVPDVGDEQPLYEVDGVGTLHNRRDGWFYLGGLKSLTSSDDPQPVIFDPYPDYNSEEWRTQWRGDFVACQGPRGRPLDRTSPLDMMSIYPGNQKFFPFPMFGSHEALDLDMNVCADRCSRWTAYGHDEEKGHTACPNSVSLNWDRVNWGKLQAQCAEENTNRYKHSVDLPHASLVRPGGWTAPEVGDHIDYSIEAINQSKLQYHPRTAIVMRSWHNMRWTPNHRRYLRSMIMELSLHSGGEYQVFLMVDVKQPLNFHDDDAVRKLKKEFIPAEFHDITILFSEDVLAEWYPLIEDHRYVIKMPVSYGQSYLHASPPNHSPIRQHLQPMQLFSYYHPNFDHYAQFEMDARNTGHMYHFLTQTRAFARRQARKFLWERNAYFYVPGAHGTHSDFTSTVDRSLRGHEDATVWGPVAAPPDMPLIPAGPKPPVPSPREDTYTWGVGEEADLITLVPIFDPTNTSWTFPNVMYGLPEDLPRRASPVTTWIMSSRLLRVMHDASIQGMALVSEMSAPTWALLHGFKAVHAPHPIYLDGEWTSREVAGIFNRGEDPARMNGGSDSLWNFDHRFDHLLYRMTYMFTTRTAEDLFRRWMGWVADPGQYSEGAGSHRDAQGRYWFDEGRLEEKEFGRLCYPGMFVHTVKNTEEALTGGRAVPWR